MMTLINGRTRRGVRRQTSSRVMRVLATWLVTLAVCCLNPCAAQSEAPVDEIVEPRLLTFRDPELVMPEPIRRLSTAYLDLWIEALAGPEQELKRDVALNICRAHDEGFLDCSAAKNSLTEVLKDATAPRSVLVEIARALIVLDAREHSAALKELLRKGAGTQFELVVEPALARWSDAEMFATWKQRITARDVPRHRRLLALQALAELSADMTGDQQLHEELRTLIATSRDTAVVLEAARTLGKVKRVDLEPLARELLSSADADADTDGQRKRLAGVYLLLHHSSDGSRDLLLRVIKEGLTELRRAPMIRAAWRRLLQQDVSELASLAPLALQHSDPEVRRAAIDTLIRFPSKDGVGLLGVALDDRHPDIRRASRQGLFQLSGDESFKESIRAAGVAAVARTSWREQEQAIVLLVLLDQSIATDRMLELLHSPRGEVAIAAAWGLRRLNVAPTMVALLEYAETMDQQINDEEPLSPHEAIVLAHVFEALGRAKHQPAIPLLRRWVSKNSPRVAKDAARSAAVWSLGWLYEDSRDVELAQALKARVLDVVSLTPESAPVRHASAITLGRIGAVEVAADLKPIARQRQVVADLAAAWAVARLTGEVIPPPDAPISSGNRWKLSPIGSRK